MSGYLSVLDWSIITNQSKLIDRILKSSKKSFLAGVVLEIHGGMPKRSSYQKQSWSNLNQ